MNIERIKSVGGVIVLGVLIVCGVILTLYFLGEGVTISPVLPVFLIIALGIAWLT